MASSLLLIHPLREICDLLSLVNIPSNPATNAGEEVTKRGRINASTKEKPDSSVIQILNRRKPVRPSQPDFSTCRA
jgi:hypothetical protein